MKFAKQENERGCCIACVAMLTGVSHESLWQELTTRFSPDEILCASVEFWLQYLEDRFGFDCTRDYWELSELDALANIPKGTRYFCAYGLVESHPKSDPFNTHAFVLDENGVVFDPVQESPNALPLEHYRTQPMKLLIVASVESPKM